MQDRDWRIGQLLSPVRYADGSRTGGPAAWWESPWVVLPLLFVVLGPFALPLLWRSRRFTRPWKTALSVVVVGITLFAVWQVCTCWTRRWHRCGN